MKESKAVYVTKRYIRNNILHREYQLYNNKITYEFEKPIPNGKRSYDVGVQYNWKRDNVVCTCKNFAGWRRQQETRYFCSSPRQLFVYNRSRSYTGIGVGSVKTLPRKKLYRIHLPETNEMGVGSCDLSPYIVRKNRLVKGTSNYDQRRTSSKCVGGVVEVGLDCVMSVKLSPINVSKSGATSPKEPAPRKTAKNIEIDSHVTQIQIPTTSAQIGTDDIAGDVARRRSKITKEPSISEKKFEKKKAEVATSVVKSQGDRIMMEEKSFSSDSLVQHVHNLENPSQDKETPSVNTMDYKLDKEYMKIFTTKSKDMKTERSTEKPCNLNTASVLRRRFDALRRNLEKTEDSRDNSKRSVIIVEGAKSKTESQLSNASRRDASITSDPPSLEGRSYSNCTRPYNPYTAKYSQRGKFQPEAFHEKSYTGAEENDESSSQHIRMENPIDSEYSHGVKGMFKLWGKKFNLDGNEFVGNKRESPVTSIELTHEEQAKELEAPDSIEKTPTEEEKVEKKGGKKFFFFKRKPAKNKTKDKEAFKRRKEVTTGRCEVKDGLSIKIGGNTNYSTNPGSPKKIVNSPSPERYEEMLKKAWLMKYLTNSIESRNSVKVRWNNKSYSASSSTVFELMGDIYKNTGVTLKSKSEIMTDKSSYYKSFTKQHVNFVQNIEAWMIPRTIPDKPVILYNNSSLHKKDSQSIEVSMFDQKWLIDKSQAFAHKIEVVLHSNNLEKFHKADSNAQFLKIDIPKGFFSDDTSSADDQQRGPTSEEEVYKIVEYDNFKSNSQVKQVKKEHDHDTGDHVQKDIKVNISVRDSSDRECESKILDTVIKGPSTQRDVVTQGSDVFVPRKCDVIGVGIITQRDIREVRPKSILRILEYETDEESEHSVEQNVMRKCEFAESFLQEYYKSCVPFSFDPVSWCVSDSHLQGDLENDSNSRLSNGDGCKSCPNIGYEFNSTQSSLRSSRASLCSQVFPTTAATAKVAEQENFSKNTKKKDNKKKSNDIEVRVLPKDSLEVFKVRKIYAKTNKKWWRDYIMASKPLSSTPNRAKPILKGSETQDCPPLEKSCSNKIYWPEKKDKKPKHVSLPDCDEMNDLVAKALADKSVIPGILIFGRSQDSSATCNVKKEIQIDQTPFFIDNKLPDCREHCKKEKHPHCEKLGADECWPLPNAFPKPNSAPQSPYEETPKSPSPYQETRSPADSQANSRPDTPTCCRKTEWSERPLPPPMSPCCSLCPKGTYKKNFLDRSILPPMARATPQPKPCASPPSDPCATPKPKPGKNPKVEKIKKSKKPKSPCPPTPSCPPKPCYETGSPSQPRMICSSPGTPPLPPCCDQSPKGIPKKTSFLDRLKYHRKVKENTDTNTCPEPDPCEVRPQPFSSQQKRHEQTMATNVSHCNLSPCKDLPPPPPPCPKPPPGAKLPCSGCPTPPCYKPTEDELNALTCKPKDKCEKKCTLVSDCPSSYSIEYDDGWERDDGCGVNVENLAPMNDGDYFPSSEQPYYEPPPCEPASYEPPPCAPSPCGSPSSDSNYQNTGIRKPYPKTPAPTVCDSHSKGIEAGSYRGQCSQTPKNNLWVCDRDCSSRTGISGIHLKKKAAPRKTCASDCQAWDKAFHDVIRINSRERITINLRDRSPSTDEIREPSCYTVKNEYGQTFVRNPLVQDLYNGPNSNRATPVTVHEMQSINCPREEKSTTSLTNLVQIKLKLRVSAGDKATEINIGNEGDVPKDEGKPQLGKDQHDIFMMKNDKQREIENNNNNNDIDIRIVIKNFKPEKKKPIQKFAANDEFSKKISDKFHTVSTGYDTGIDFRDVNAETDRVFSIHRATVDLTSGSKSDCKSNGDALTNNTKTSKQNVKPNNDELKDTPSQTKDQKKDSTLKVKEICENADDKEKVIIKSISFAKLSNIQIETDTSQIETDQSKVEDTAETESKFAKYTTVVAKSVTSENSCEDKMLADKNVMKKIFMRKSNTENTDTDSVCNKTSDELTDIENKTSGEPTDTCIKSSAEASNLGNKTSNNATITTYTSEEPFDLGNKTSDDPTELPTSNELTDVGNNASDECYVNKEPSEVPPDNIVKPEELVENKQLVSFKDETPKQSKKSCCRRFIKRYHRDEKKEMLKKVFEHGETCLKRPKTKNRIQKLKNMLKAILTSDSSEPDELVVPCNKLADDITYSSVKPDFFKNSGSLNNYLMSSTMSEKNSEAGKYHPTEEFNSHNDSDWSLEDGKTETPACMCKTFASRLKMKMNNNNAFEGGCCCRKKLTKTDQEILCDIHNDDEFYFLNYRSAEVVDVETQHSRYFSSDVNSMQMFIESKTESVIQETENLGEEEDENVAEEVAAQLIERATPLKQQIIQSSKTMTPNYTQDNTNKRLGISEDDKIVFLETNSTRISVGQKPHHDFEKHQHHRKDKGRVMKMTNPADILQLYETKKAVLEIYAEKKVKDDGKHIVAKLPRLVFDTEYRDEKGQSSGSKNVETRNIIMNMMSIGR